MGRAFEYRKATKLKRWGHMAKTFTKLGKQIAIAVKAGGPEPENNPTLRAIIANCKRENMPKDNIARAIKNACGKDTYIVSFSKRSNRILNNIHEQGVKYITNTSR